MPMLAISRGATLDKAALEAGFLKDPSGWVAEIAERVGLSSSPCWRRIKRLEDAGVIQRRVTILDRYPAAEAALASRLSLVRAIPPSLWAEYKSRRSRRQVLKADNPKKSRTRIFGLTLLSWLGIIYALSMLVALLKN